MHGSITNNSSDNVLNLIETHRAVRRVYLVASSEFDKSDDDDESYEALIVGELVSHAFGVERRVLNDLMSATPRSLEWLRWCRTSMRCARPSATSVTTTRTGPKRSWPG